MKKLLGLVVLSLLVALLASPFLLGLQGENEVRRVAGELDDYPGYRVEIEDYSRGYLQTRARVRIGLDLGQMQGADAPNLPPMDFTVLLNIEHGPLLRAEGLSLGLYHWEVLPTRETLDRVHQTLALKGDEPFYRLSGKTSLLGHTVFEDSARAFELREDSFYADFAGYAGQGAVTREGYLSYLGELKEAGFTEGNQGGRIEGVQVSLEADLDQLDWDTMVYPGEAMLSINHIEFRSPFGMAGTLKKLMMESQMSLSDDGGAFDVKSVLSLDSFVGDAMSVTDAEMDFTLENLDKDAYRAYLEAYSEMMDSSNAQAQTPAMPDFSRYFTPELVRQFVERGPEMRFDRLAFTLAQGQFEADLAVRVKEDAEVPAQMAGFFWLMGAVNIEAAAEMDRPLAELFAQYAAMAQGMGAGGEGNPGADMLELLKAQGLVSEQDGKITTGLSLEDGAFTVNGQPMPLGGAPMGQP